MTKWVLTFLCDSVYLTRCLSTISSCRSVGSWEDDIVMLVDQSIDINNTFLREQTNIYRIQIRQLPDLEKPLLEKLVTIWNLHKDAPNYPVVTKKFVQYLKFYLFDTWFKQWDVVFYIDAGMCIYGDLNRMKMACEPDPGVLYVHSNGYPLYSDFGMLRRQFETYLDTFITDQLESHYDLNADSFQSTAMIFHTSCNKETTVSDLWDLTYKYPIGNRNDQGILNLYFYKRWKQIPLRDSDGWLYDFHERHPYTKADYLMLKYPLNQLFFR
jgi:hypothetical protein